MSLELFENKSKEDLDKISPGLYEMVQQIIEYRELYKKELGEKFGPNGADAIILLSEIKDGDKIEEIINILRGSYQNTLGYILSEDCRKLKVMEKEEPEKYAEYIEHTKARREVARERAREWQEKEKQSNNIKPAVDPSDVELKTMKKEEPERYAQYIKHNKIKG